MTTHHSTNYIKNERNYAQLLGEYRHDHLSRTVNVGSKGCSRIKLKDVSKYICKNNIKEVKLTINFQERFQKMYGNGWSIVGDRIVLDSKLYKGNYRIDLIVTYEDII